MNLKPCFASRSNNFPLRLQKTSFTHVLSSRLEVTEMVFEAMSSTVEQLNSCVVSLGWYQTLKSLRTNSQHLSQLELLDDVKRR